MGVQLLPAKVVHVLGRRGGDFHPPEPRRGSTILKKSICKLHSFFQFCLDLVHHKKPLFINDLLCIFVHHTLFLGAKTMIYGYARVSTKEQETHMQIDALRSAGAIDIRHEKCSSVGSRPELQKLLDDLRAGDVLLVYKMDRIARSLKDLLSILDRLTSVGATIKSLTEPLDTSGPIGVFMVQVLGAVAQLERSIIRERSVAGQVAAYKRGVKLGRNNHATPPEVVEEMKVLRATGSYTWEALGKKFGIHGSTAKRLVTGYKTRQKMPVLSKYIDDSSDCN